MAKFNTRIQFKADTLENWLKAENFTPLPNEVLLVTDQGNFFVGDGSTTAKIMAENAAEYYFVPAAVAIAVDDITALFD